MNLGRLHQLEAEFLERYPGGFDNPEMQAIAARHRKDRMEAGAQAGFGPEAFGNEAAVCERFARLLGKSSVLSVFEKPRLREAIASFTPPEVFGFAEALKDRLHGDARRGFEGMVRILSDHKLAKWPVISVLPAYLRPQDEVFVKPTTAKAVVAAMDLPLTYRPRPDWAFYEGYRAAFHQMIAATDKSLSPSTLAFGGFLMMSL
ncbi:hypothetical protein [Frigidibacter sp. ROC022]|uniref:hypothetical protein n=1 Tax=Frigidibacter sp. ROC022 TaxID=2971796 RepID=UPI00215B28D0|nr:hypothetical protein [Frigidibacter sp. ROC022]MCR8723023.1 hypothetical protein [Frigidibacter sp. ROC022]